MIKQFLLCLLILAAAGLRAQTDDPFTADCKKYFYAASFDQMYKGTIDQMVNAIAGQWPEVSEATWNEVRKEMKTRSIDELFTKLAEVYKEKFTHAEIKQIVAFYQTPAGKKLASETMNLTTESLFVVEDWAKTISPEVKRVMDEVNSK